MPRRITRSSFGKRRITIELTILLLTGNPIMSTTAPKDWNIQFGPRVIESHCGLIDDYVVLTSPSAMTAVRDQFRHEPKAISYVTSQEQDQNEALVQSMPQAKYVLGIGGGMALDAAKYVASKLDADLITIPTVVSTGAIFQAGVPERYQGQLKEIPDLKVPEFVLLDTDVIRAAPPHLNSAGMAECICWLSSLASWRWWCEQGLPGPEWDQSAADEVENWVRGHVDRYVGDLDEDGRPGPDAIYTSAMVNIERFDLKIWTMQAVHGIDHLLDNTFVYVHLVNLLHGELVALGTLINNILCGSQFDQARDMLRACRTRYRPEAIGCTWDQVRQVLEHIPEHCDVIDWPKTWLHHGQVDDELFARIVSQVEA